jgi:hypothetical protein
MRNPVISLLIALAFVMTGVMPAVPASAAERASYGPWTVTTLSRDSGDWRIESYKLDRDLIAWTETNAYTGQRRLFANDGLTTVQLGTFPIGSWESNLFFDAVDAGYDVADGVVVWVANDGIDQEIYKYQNGATSRVSNNTYNDARPRTSEGRIAWTSYPSSAYNLMVVDSKGMRRIDGWHVLNYEFSGKNLYWMNTLPNENWFRVFSNDGIQTRAIGKGDDRPLKEYFITDDRGSATWEYSTKQWNYDKREIFVSSNGGDAVRTLQRDVPPTVTEIKDVRGGQVFVSVHDLLTSKTDDWSLLDTGSGWESTVTTAVDTIRIRAFDDGHVRHVVPENGSPLIVRYNDGFEEWMTLERVIHGKFEADGKVIAAARMEGGALLTTDRKTTVVSTASAIRDIDTRGGMAAWIAGQNGNSVLEVASQGILVHSGGGTKRVTGRLVKVDSSRSVYLAATDGNRYVFNNEKSFFSWFSDFRSVKVVGSAELSAMPLAGSVVYRPGSTLVKTVSSSRVYMVAGDGSLRWVTDASVLTAKYGPLWYQRIDVIPDAFTWSYTYGPSVGTVDAFATALTSSN